jgi:hypothetical protein
MVYPLEALSASAFWYQLPIRKSGTPLYVRHYATWLMPVPQTQIYPRTKIN